MKTQNLHRWIEIRPAPLEIHIRLRPCAFLKYFALFLNLLRRPHLQRQVGPGMRPQEEHEFKKLRHF